METFYTQSKLTDLLYPLFKKKYLSVNDSKSSLANFYAHGAFTGFCIAIAQLDLYYLFQSKLKREMDVAKNMELTKLSHTEQDTLLKEELRKAFNAGASMVVDGMHQMHPIDFEEYYEKRYENLQAKSS